MGVQNQGALLFKLKEILFEDIVYLLEQLHAERKRATPSLTLRVRPKVTIDASLIAYKFLGNSLHPSDGVFIISAALANRNIDVLIISDPPMRHHSKRAHHQRVGKRESTKLRLMLSRIELSRSGDDVEKMNTISNEIRKLEKAESRTSLPADFGTRLHKLHQEYNHQAGKGEITMETAPFQADPSIADVAIRGGCEAIISGDSDFAMYVGTGGPDNLGDIMLRDIKINQRTSTIAGGTIITGQRNIASKIAELLAHRESSDVFPTEPKFPLFDGVGDIRTRALTAHIAKQWRTSLLEWTKSRGLDIHTFASEDPPQDNSIVSKKRKAGEEICKGRKVAHNYCCVEGCEANGLTAVLKRVSEYPPELPTDASHQRQITYARKRFMRRERTERLALGRTCEETNLRACTHHWELVTGKWTQRDICRADGSIQTENISVPPFWAPRTVGEQSFASPPVTLSMNER